MPTYHLKCRRHTGNIGSKKVILSKSRYAICNSKKSEFLKQKHNKKLVGNIIKQTC